MMQERNNVAAGAFVLAGLVLAVLVIVLLADWERLFTPTQQVSVRYTLSDGIKGLQPGSPVDVGGVQRGSVTAIADEFDDDGLLSAAVVTFTIPERYQVFENARIELREPLIGAGTRLNIRSFGGPADDREPAGESWSYEHGIDPPIAGQLAGQEVVADAVREMGIGDEQRAQMQNIIANLDRLVAVVGADPQPVGNIIANLEAGTGTLAEDLPAISENIRTGTEELRELVAETRGRSEHWFVEIETLLARTNDAVAQADEAVELVSAMLEENREPLNETVLRAAVVMANAEQITEQVRDETLGQIAGLLDEANTAMVNIREATHDVQGFVTSQRPVIERTIANARIVSDQLKLTAIEVRRAPWRLLYDPTDDEINTDNVYDAARSFAMAATTLNATADSLQAIVDRHGSLDHDDANVTLILDNLRHVFDKFDDAENKFWEALDEMPSR